MDQKSIDRLHKNIFKQHVQHGMSSFDIKCYLDALHGQDLPRLLNIEIQTLKEVYEERITGHNGLVMRCG